ncbi:MAG: hypothetical protein ACR5KV_06985 [Wolbachia sp.]
MATIAQIVATGAITPIAAPAKATDPISSTALGKIDIAAAARPTPIAILAAHIGAPKKKLSLENRLLEIIRYASKAAGIAATIPPVINGDKAVKLSPKPVSVPITAPVIPSAITHVKLSTSFFSYNPIIFQKTF